jgi:hypothetical protein
MRKQSSIAPQTRNNWLIDLSLFLGALMASITGVYFLFLPVGGYQGGRNPMYGIVILFERHSWEDLHIWFGILMIAAAIVHIIVHWKWIIRMLRQIFYEVVLHEMRLNNRSRMNVLINAALGSGFILAAISGIYLLFVPGGRNAFPDPNFILSRPVWDLVHTWSGIWMIVAAVVHFSIHWKWVTKVTRKLWSSVLPEDGREQVVKM